MRTYRDQTTRVHAVGWSPDCTRTASADTTGLVHVWDAATGATVSCIAVMEGNSRTGSMQSGGRPLADAWLQPVTMDLYRSGKRRDIIKHAGGSRIAVSIIAHRSVFRRTWPAWVSRSLFC